MLRESFVRPPLWPVLHLIMMGALAATGLAPQSASAQDRSATTAAATSEVNLFGLPEGTAFDLKRTWSAKKEGWVLDKFELYDAAGRRVWHKSAKNMPPVFPGRGKPVLTDHLKRGQIEGLFRELLDWEMEIVKNGLPRILVPDPLVPPEEKKSPAPLDDESFMNAMGRVIGLRLGMKPLAAIRLGWWSLIAEIPLILVILAAIPADWAPAFLAAWVAGEIILDPTPITRKTMLLRILLKWVSLLPYLWIFDVPNHLGPAVMAMGHLTYDGIFSWRAAQKARRIAAEVQKRWGARETTFDSTQASYQLFSSFFQSIAETNPAAGILDIGSGRDFPLTRLALSISNRFQVTAVDPASIPEPLIPTGIHYEQRPIETYQNRGAPIEAVVSFLSFEYSRVRKTLRVLKQQTAPGVRLLFLVHDRESRILQTARVIISASGLVQSGIPIEALRDLPELLGPSFGAITAKKLEVLAEALKDLDAAVRPFFDKNHIEALFRRHGFAADVRPHYDHGELVGWTIQAVKIQNQDQKAA